MKENFIGLDINKDRNIMLDKIAELHKKGAEVHKKYRDYLGQYQEIQRQKIGLLNKVSGVKE